MNAPTRPPDEIAPLPFAPDLRVADHGPIRVIILAAPARRNPLSLRLLQDLRALIVQSASEPALRVLILAAEGPAFCAGHDLREIQAARALPDQGKSFFVDLMQACAALMLAIRDCPLPVIAAIEGIATAAGCQLVATADLAVAGEAARFATPGVHIGLFCSTPMVALSRNLGRKAAMEMLLTGEAIAARKALELGLINRVVPAGEALANARALAETIARKPALTLKLGKGAFYRQAELPLAEAYSYASEVMVENMLAREADEGIAAFLARR